MAEPASTEGVPFDWRDFVGLAELLAERHDEASLRTSVSRGYYAVFHLARRVLERHDGEFHAMRGSDSHKLVWDRLAALDRRQAKTAVRVGKNLLAVRKHADYQLGGDNWPRRATESLIDVRRAVAALNDLLGAS